MRLNTKTYPAFDFLERGLFEHLPIDQMFGELLTTEQKLFDFLISVKETYKQVDKKYFLTNTFKDAILTAMPKITDKKLHLNEIPSDCGVFLLTEVFYHQIKKKMKNLRDDYVNVAINIAESYGYKCSEHIINVMVSVMMHRDKYQTGGGFVEAVCNNDLEGACSRADSECISYLRLFTLVKRFGYLKNEVC